MLVSVTGKRWFLYFNPWKSWISSFVFQIKVHIWGPCVCRMVVWSPQCPASSSCFYICPCWQTVSVKWPQLLGNNNTGIGWWLTVYVGLESWLMSLFNMLRQVALKGQGSLSVIQQQVAMSAQVSVSWAAADTEQIRWKAVQSHLHSNQTNQSAFQTAFTHSLTGKQQSTGCIVPLIGPIC